MSDAANSDAGPPRYSYLGLALSVGAIMALMLAPVILLSAAAFLLVDPHVLKDAAEASAAKPPHDPASVEASWYVSFAAYVWAVCCIWLVWRAAPRDTFARRLGWADWTGDRQFWALLATTMAYGVATGLLADWLLPQAKDWTPLPASKVGLAFSLVTTVFLGPVAEEMFFRGWIATALRTRLSFAPTLVITSAFFAAMHYDPSHVYSFIVFPIGLALGFVRERYQSIKASAFFHGLYNLFEWTIAFLALSLS